MKNQANSTKKGVSNRERAISSETATRRLLFGFRTPNADAVSDLFNGGEPLCPLLRAQASILLGEDGTELIKSVFLRMIGLGHAQS